MCSGSETVAYLRLIDSCITQLKAQGPSRTCNESKEEEEGGRTSKTRSYLARGKDLHREKTGLLIHKHDHFTPTREIERHIRALARNPKDGSCKDTPHSLRSRAGPSLKYVWQARVQDLLRPKVWPSARHMHCWAPWTQMDGIVARGCVIVEGRKMYGYLENGIQTPMARGRSS